MQIDINNENFVTGWFEGNKRSLEIALKKALEGINGDFTDKTGNPMCRNIRNGVESWITLIGVKNSQPVLVACITVSIRLNLTVQCLVFALKIRHSDSFYSCEGRKDLAECVYSKAGLGYFVTCWIDSFNIANAVTRTTSTSCDYFVTVHP